MKTYNRVKFEVHSMNGSRVIGYSADLKMAAVRHLVFQYCKFLTIFSFLTSRSTVGLKLKSVARTILELERIELCCQGYASPLTFKGHRRSKVKVAFD